MVVIAPSHQVQMQTSYRTFRCVCIYHWERQARLSISHFYCLLTTLFLQATGHLSDDDDPEHIQEVTPTFSRTRPGRRYELHTHLDASQIMYHLGRKPFDMANSNPRLLQLDREAAKNWYSFVRPAVQKQLPKIRIPGGKMARK